MMHIYLPIAEMSVNIFLILGIGASIGFISGVFGVGGGFLLTPLLFFLGVPAAVAVGTQMTQIVASSVSGVLVHWRKGNVDVKMGLVLLSGGLVGSTIGVSIFTWMQTLGQTELFIRLCYVVFLGIIGGMMFWESVRALLRTRRGKQPSRGKLHQHTWLHGLPFKMRFRRSKLYISALLPITVGFFVGVISSVMGVSGIVLIPAMIYILGMPTSVVIGTSLFQIIFVAANAAFFQAYLNQTVDIVLALILVFGGVIGAQIGTKVGSSLKGEQLRSLLAVLVLSVALKLLYDLVVPPADVFSISVAMRH